MADAAVPSADGGKAPTVVIRRIGTLLTMCSWDPVPGADARNALASLKNAALVLEGGRVKWAGPDDDLPDPWRSGADMARLDAAGRVVSPGLVDCHTHLVYGGDRSGEFAKRAAGLSYSQIAELGGGIVSTVRQTRAASEDQLAWAARPRLDRMLRHGITTVEVKSGYGLTTESELAILRTIRRLSQEGPIELVPTFMGAHAVPAAYKSQGKGGVDRYVQLVTEEMIPAVAAEDLAQYCDIFVEEGYFTPGHARQVAYAARQAGMGLKLHVDQIAEGGGGAALAAELEAVSADHLDKSSEEGLYQMAEAGTIGVLLPGASMFVGDPFPDARRVIEAGIRVALSTDCNPGTCPTEDLPLMMTLACTSCGMTVPEAWLAVTRHAALAVGRHDLGYLSPGAAADLVVWGFRDPAHLVYHFGHAHADIVIKGGRPVLERPATLCDSF